MLSSVCCWCHLKANKAKPNRPNRQIQLASHSYFGRFSFNTSHNHLKQAHACIYAWHVDSSEDPRTSWRWFIDALSYDCKIYVMELWSCFEHSCCCHFFFHTNNREWILEHKHLLWLRIALRLQLRPPKFCQWYLGLGFCGCSHMKKIRLHPVGCWLCLCVWFCFSMCRMCGMWVSFS